MGPLTKEARASVTKKMKKNQRYSVSSLPSSLPTRSVCKHTRPLSPLGKSRQRRFSASGGGQDKGTLRQAELAQVYGLCCHLPMSAEKLLDIIVRPLPIIFEKSWWEVSEDWKKQDVTLNLKKGKEEDPT